MTTVNEAVQRPALRPAAKPPSKSAPITSGLIASFAWWALVAGVLGVTMHRGFGVSLPFIPTFLLASLFGAVAKGLAQTIGEAWHGERVKADMNLIAAQESVRQAQLAEFSKTIAGL